MGIARRLEKARRLARWKWARGMPVWWHIGRPNFGDDINPTLFQRLTGHPIRFGSHRESPHLLGAGSILAKATSASVVCGSGYLSPPPHDRVNPAMVFAVRGTLSLAALHRRSETALGDPLVLIADHLSPRCKRYQFGLIPHVLSVSRWLHRASRDLHIVDPGDDPWTVVNEIAACEVVISQSLHGLIVANALGIPNVWVAPSDQMVGGRFKFDDYFSTLERPKECVPECSEVFERPGILAASVEAYRFDKDLLRSAIVSASHWLMTRLRSSLR